MTPGLVLITLTALVYYVHFLVFRDPRHIFLYFILVVEWVDYMDRLKAEYPYLFSLAARTNPFDATASVEVK